MKAVEVKLHSTSNATFFFKSGCCCVDSNWSECNAEGKEDTGYWRGDEKMNCKAVLTVDDKCGSKYLEK